MTPSSPTTRTPGTRAVLRRVEAGIREKCEHCKDYTRFRAKGRLTNNYVIINRYGRDGDPNVWDDVIFMHQACYRAAGEPYGKAET